MVHQAAAFGQSSGAKEQKVAAHACTLLADGKITVLTSKVDVGQGSRAQITQAAAEELRVAVDQIKLVMADTGSDSRRWGNSGQPHDALHCARGTKGAAAAREILLEQSRPGSGV